MDEEKFLRDYPKSIKGHHFSDFLSCPTKAWFEFYGEEKSKAPDPSYLKEMYKVGRTFESKIYSLPEYSDNIIIPHNLKQEEKLKRTIDAITNKKHKYIFQAYFLEEGKIGIADILERIDNDDGSSFYRIGEIKSSKEITVAFILQMIWYDELLKNMQGISSGDGFLIMGDSKRYEINYSKYYSTFLSVKEELEKLRRINKDKGHLVPQPVLCNYCSSCSWRYICMKQLTENKHISLIYGIGRKRAELFAKFGVTKWEELENLDDEFLIKSGLDIYECQAIRSYLIILNENLALLKENLSSEVLESMLPCAMELSRNKEGEYEEKSIGYKDSTGIHIFEINNSIKNQNIQDFINQVQNKKLVFYGIDYVSFKKLYSVLPEKSKISAFDMFKIFDRLLHNPFCGLDLNSVNSFIEGNQNKIALKNIPRLNIHQRLNYLDNVIKWLIVSNNKLKEEITIGTESDR